MLHRMKSSREIGRKVSPPQPVFMSDEQKSDYLSSLRNNRPARPIGSRPLPSKRANTAPSLAEELSSPRTEYKIALLQQEGGSITPHHESWEHPQLANGVSSCLQSDGPNLLHPSVTSQASIARPLTSDSGQKSHSIRGRKVSPPTVVSPSARSFSGEYRESGARWAERQEAISLREALEEMDHHSEDKRIHDAALDEAAELVWRHRNPKAAEQEKNAAYANPEVQREGGHRSTMDFHRNTGPCDPLLQRKEAKEPIPIPTIIGPSEYPSKHHFGDGKQDYSIRSKHIANEQTAKNETDEKRLGSKFAAVDLNDSAAQMSRRKSSGQRRTSNGSSKDGFPNAHGQIYEDLGAISSQIVKATMPSSNTCAPLRPGNQNSQLRGSRPLLGRSTASDLGKSKPLDRFEIHKNPPSQSRSAGYTRNSLPKSVDAIPEVETPPSKNGVEIRGEDIRAATSMKLKDRSPKLPLPTAVSDCPERPIVSFDTDWKPGDVRDKDTPAVERPGPRPITTTAVPAASAPVVPTINISSLEETADPTISMPHDDLTPTITVSTDEPPSKSVADQPPARRPLPQPSKTTPGKLPTANTSSRLSWLNPSSRGSVPTATCANCALPISGRIVTASGAGASSPSLKARFHPECFTCHHCSTALECVAFYPEPEDRRLKRIEADGLSSDIEGGELRFYCHLDFHEFFSPRCRSCKTPIEGEVIVAAGAEWHVGHFFCAECGDPFDSNTPFVEKDNYAYCVSCHTRRTSARCKGCKKQILDETTVQALGVQWHAGCFNCYECGGGFGDDGRFFVRDVTIGGTEKEKRRGIRQKIEERAVCEGCEGRRLKA